MNMKRKPILTDTEKEELINKIIFNAKDEQIRAYPGNISNDSNVSNSDSRNNTGNNSVSDSGNNDRNIIGNNSRNIDGNISGNVSGNNSKNIVITKPEKQEKPKRVSYYLKPSTIRKIEKLAANTDMYISEFMQKLLNEVLDNIKIE